jgi:serine O-acetyltransferase
MSTKDTPREQPPTTATSSATPDAPASASPASSTKAAAPRARPRKQRRAGTDTRKHDRRLVDEVRAAWVRHGRTLGEPGFWAVTTYALGRAAKRSSFLPLRALGGAAYGVLSTGLRFTSGIELNREATIGHDLHLVHGWNVKVHPATVLGDRVGLMHDVTLGTTPERPYPPTIGNDVFIGAGARVLGDIVVGDGARIAANSLVVSDVPPGATAIGVPARVVRYNGRTEGDRRARDRRLRVVPVVVDRRVADDDRRKSMRRPPVSG